MGSFEFFQGDQKIRLFTGHVFAVVVIREVQGEGFAFTELHAEHGFFKFFEHLAFADQELEGFCLAALEWLAVDLAFEVDGDAVAFLRRRFSAALGEGAALFAQDVDGFIDRGFSHFGRDFVDL